MSFTVPRDDLREAGEALEPLKAELGISGIATDETMGKVSIIGAGMKTHPGVAAKVFTVLGEHGINQHGYHIYVQQNKVPFIVRVPGIPPRVVEEAVGHVDLFPSLLNLLRAPDEPQLLGRSFVDLMLGSSGERRLVYGEVEYAETGDSAPLGLRLV